MIRRNIALLVSVLGVPVALAPPASRASARYARESIDEPGGRERLG